MRAYSSCAEVPVRRETCATVAAKPASTSPTGVIVVESGGSGGAATATVTPFPSLVASSASSSSSAIVAPATNRGKRCGVLVVGTSVPLTDALAQAELFGGEVKRLLPEAAVLPLAVRRRLFERAVERELASEEEEELDLGQEKRLEVKEVVPAAESTLPEYILELAKVDEEEE